MRVYLDAMVWIYALEGDPAFGVPAKGLLQRLLAGRHKILTSRFLLAEVLVQPVRKNDTFIIAAYKRALLTSDAVEVVEFTTTTAMRFAALRAAHRVKQPDAIHLALAASTNADAFITVDNRLQKLTIPGIGLIGNLSFRFA